jgi:rhodanese-related sulfurtransferase
VVSEGSEEEAITRLSRVGFDNVIGYLKGGFEAWKKAGKEVDSIPSMSPGELAKALKTCSPEQVIDVRRPGEYAAEHVKDAASMPLDYFNDYMGDLEQGGKYFIYCATGYRSLIAISMLKARGFDGLADVRGGFEAMQDSGKFETTDYVCPSTLKRQKAKEVVAGG